MLLDAVVDLAKGATRVVDGTVGLGGHAEALLGAGPDLLMIDCDPDALSIAAERLSHRGRFLQGRFSDNHVLDVIDDFHPDFIVLDLGVSSLQLDREERGFSFRPGTPLDMRMDRAGPTAADWLNRTGSDELTKAFRDYGDERGAVKLARSVVRRRSTSPFRTADDLVNAIREVLGPRSGPREFARLFQAVRIALNRELDALAAALPALRDALTKCGVLAVISYHSGEDRIVKHSFREWSRACVCPAELPVCQCRGHPLGALLTRRAVSAPPDEIRRNPRARSARLRAFRVE